jgi:hypothetical protein
MESNLARTSWFVNYVIAKNYGHVGMEWQIAEAFVQILRKRLIGLEELEGTDAAPEGIDEGLALVRNLLAYLESTPVLH